jgi:hypothetical protein
MRTNAKMSETSKSIREARMAILSMDESVTFGGKKSVTMAGLRRYQGVNAPS